MRIFDVYQHPRYGMQAVRRGFSWLAFLMPALWAVRRGLGVTTLLLLVVVTTLMFDLVQLVSDWVNNPIANLTILAALVVLVGVKPGFAGYRWHAQALEDDQFSLVCTVVAESRRQAIRAAANDDFFNGPIRIAAA